MAKTTYQEAATDYAISYLEVLLKMETRIASRFARHADRHDDKD